jgi:hypothetical protein
LPLKVSGKRPGGDPREVTPEKLKKQGQICAYASIAAASIIFLASLAYYLKEGDTAAFLVVGAEIPIAILSTYIIIDRVVRAYTLKLNRTIEALLKAPRPEVAMQQPQAPVRAAPVLQPAPLSSQFSQKTYRTLQVEQKPPLEIAEPGIQATRRQQTYLTQAPPQAEQGGPGSSVKRCPYCGRELPYGDLHIMCPFCGKFLR